MKYRIAMLIFLVANAASARQGLDELRVDGPRLNATMQQMVFGIILIVAIALTIDRSKMRIVK